jgi:hypothetical protein
MKKLLLIVFVLAICVLAFPHGVMAATQTPDPVIINAAYEGTALAFTADKVLPESGPWSWPLSVNSPTDNKKSPALTFSVASPSNWVVGVSGSDGGYMRGDLGTLKTAFGMEVNNDDTNNPINGGINVLSGGPILATNFASDIWQPVQGDDFGSSGGYAITLTFTITADDI